MSTANGPIPRCQSCAMPNTVTTLYREPEHEAWRCGWCAPELKRLHEIEDAVLDDSHANAARQAEALRYAEEDARG